MLWNSRVGGWMGWAVFLLASPVHAGTTVGDALQMLFVENRGQLPPDIAFETLHPAVVAVSSEGRVYVNGMVLDFGGVPRSVEGDLPLPTKVSYFLDGTSVSGLSSFRRVWLREVRPHLDVALTAAGRGVLEVQFFIHPGGKVEEATVEVKGGTVVLREDGVFGRVEDQDLVRISDIRAYQGSRALPVTVRVRENRVGFEVTGADPHHTLVLDPFVSALLSSMSGDPGEALAIGPGGDIYVAGWTYDPATFTPSRFVHTNTGGASGAMVFVSRLSPGLDTLRATAILGADGVANYGYDVVVAPGGDVYVSGTTTASANFAPSRTVFGNPGDYDAFVTRLSGDLSQHLGTAILASPVEDRAYGGLQVNPADSTVFVSGFTDNSSQFVSPQTLFGTRGGRDAFVVHLSGDLSQVLATAILASSGGEDATELELDTVWGTGTLYVVGWCENVLDFAPSRTLMGPAASSGGYVTRLDTSLSTHLGTAILTSASSNPDPARGLALDGASGRVVVTGYTSQASTFAPSRTIYGTPGGSYDAYVSVVDSALSQHLGTAILATPGTDYTRRVAVIGLGDIAIVGQTTGSGSLPPPVAVHGSPGGYDGFVTKFSSGLTLLQTAVMATPYNYGSFERLRDVKEDGMGNLYVAGDVGAPFSADTVFSGGTPDGLEALVGRFDLALAVEEGGSRETGLSPAEIRGHRVVFQLDQPGYAGFDLWDPQGRLVDRVSLGYLPAGRYEHPLPSLPPGVYTLLLRLGDRVERLKVLR